MDETRMISRPIPCYPLSNSSGSTGSSGAPCYPPQTQTGSSVLPLFFRLIRILATRYLGFFNRPREKALIY